MPVELVSGEELIGNALDLDEVSGYDLVGALGRHRPSAHWNHHGGRQQHRPNYNQAMAQAAAYKQAQAGVIIRDQTPTKARRLVLPMSSTGTVTAGTSATITARPQTIAFKPARIVIPATVAPDFTIEDIKVGNKSQLAQSGSLPAEAFTQTSFEVAMDMDTVQTSQDFVLQLTNISGANRTFRAAVFGRSADY